MLLRSCCLVLATAWLGGCATGYEPGTAKGPLGSAQRVLGIDFSTAAIARRSAGASRTLAHIGNDTQRIAHITAVPTTLVREAFTDLAAAPRRGAALLRAEVSRVPTVPKGAAAHFSLRHAAQRLAENLANLPLLLGVDKRPMGELDDRRHRTDPHDDHPEAGFLARLRRRLLL
ncbi:MAG: hypothetical protein ABIP94_25515 [Planctomycetota bacterium]